MSTQLSRILCIFCEGALRSEEHVWSEWTRQLIGATRDTHHWIVSGVTNSRGEIVREYTTKRIQGGIHNVTVKAPCEKCNNGWMNVVDSAARPYLEHLFLGRSRNLTHWAQRSLARLLVMKFMVLEFFGDIEPLCPQEERDCFRRGVDPSERWRIWIGSQGARNINRTQTRHSITEANAAHTTVQIIAMGDLVAIGAYSTRKQQLPVIERSNLIYRQIFPIGEAFRWPPLTSIDRKELRLIQKSAQSIL